MPFVLATRIRFVDTDASTRIHFSAMLRYFEAAEQEFLRSLGHEFSNLEGAGMGFPRVHVECTYTSMVRYDDLMNIEVRVERVGNSSYTLAYAASVGDRPVAHGTITVVCIDLKTQRSRPLPEGLAGKLRMS
jgi:4-hydroxybenzoyl-CoA thioesterase/acyl-CoA thioester hydrolase